MDTRELKQRLYARQLQKAQYGISADPSVEIEIKKLEEAIHLAERVDIHRKVLTVLLEQRDEFGTDYVPRYIVTSIDSRRASIASLKRQLSDIGYILDETSADIDNTLDPMDAVRKKLITAKTAVREEWHISQIIQLLDDALNLIG